MIHGKAQQQHAIDEYYRRCPFHYIVVTTYAGQIAVKLVLLFQARSYACIELAHGQRHGFRD